MLQNNIMEDQQRKAVLLGLKLTTVRNHILEKTALESDLPSFIFR